jgi:hypothetical protein
MIQHNDSRRGQSYEAPQDYLKLKSSAYISCVLLSFSTKGSSA